MAYIEYTEKKKDIFVRLIAELHGTNGYFTVGHKFLVIGNIDERWTTKLQDAESLGDTWGRTVMAPRDTFVIIDEV